MYIDCVIPLADPGGWVLGVGTPPFLGDPPLVIQIKDYQLNVYIPERFLCLKSVQII